MARPAAACARGNCRAGRERRRGLRAARRGRPGHPVAGLGDRGGRAGRGCGGGAGGRGRSRPRASRLGSLQVIGVVGGLLAAILWGTSTVVASRSTRMIGSQQALGYVMLTGFVVCLVAAPLFEGVPSVGRHGAGWALLAGAASVFGLSMVYRALRIGKVGVVAPISSTEGALAAVFSVVLLGQGLSAATSVALTLVALGVIVVTFHGSRADLQLRPALYAFTAAAVFGVGLIASSQAGHAIGPLWTILVARVIGILFVVAPLALRGAFPWPGPALGMVVFSGLAEVT